MKSGKFKIRGPSGPHCYPGNIARLRTRRLNVPACQPTESGYQLSRVIDLVQQLDLESILRSTEEYKTILTTANRLAKPVAGLKAFRGKYFSVFSGEVRRNSVGDLRGVVVSKAWAKLFDRLSKLGRVFRILGLPLELAELSWDDRSPRGISANLLTGTTRWYTKTILLTPSVVAHTGIQGLGWAAEELGFQETAQDIELFARNLEDTINLLEKVIDQVYSVTNARRVIEHAESFVGAATIDPTLGRVLRGLFQDLAAQAQPLYNEVVDQLSRGE